MQETDGGTRAECGGDRLRHGIGERELQAAAQFGEPRGRQPRRADGSVEFDGDVARETRRRGGAQRELHHARDRGAVVDVDEVGQLFDHGREMNGERAMAGIRRRCRTLPSLVCTSMVTAAGL